MHNIVKTKQKQKQKQTTMQRSRTKFAAKALVLSGLGIAGRAAFQYFPSVEPLLALGIAACYFGGAGYSIPMAGAYLSSNFFVMGGPGPWAVFQAMGMLFAGLLASFSRKTRRPFTYALVAGTIVFEICVNSSWAFLTGIPSLFLAFVPAIPFSIIHLSSTIGFGMVFKGMGIERILEVKDRWMSNMQR